MSTVSNVARLAEVQRQDREEAMEFATSPSWPELDDEAFQGLAGRYVRMIEPHTEADPVGILLQLLVMIGNLIGRGPHFRVEADEHHLNLFTIQVGESAKGRKGVSAGQAKRLLRVVDPDWCEHRIQHGLSSGEGLIWAIRDQDADPSEGDTTSSGSTEEDKRLLIFEGEFASVLRVLRRDGNTLSATIRNAWDTGDLRILTKNSPVCASGAHISIVGHITRDELLRYMDSTEAGNGFGNRFLWCCVRRSKLLPEGGSAHLLDFDPLSRGLSEAVQFARRTAELRRDEKAREIWRKVYQDLSEGKPGLLGSMIARGEAQTMRLACLYALLDQSAIVRSEHLTAALAIWGYCEASARWIFGEALGDPVADEILRVLRSTPAGMTRTEITSHFSRHRTGIERALAMLLERGLADMVKERTGGRPVERWRARTGSAK